MKPKDFTLKILVKQSPKEVFEAINNVRGWWQGEFDGSSNKLNDEFSYRMEDIHFSKQKVVDLVPHEKIVWLVTESKLNFIDHKNEWTGTTIVFEISRVDSKTQVCFTHKGLLPQNECYEACSNGWTMLVKESLQRLITTGMGKKVF
jgi:anti-sigma regulatory factor (Ser/Thr protein kinase)